MARPHPHILPLVPLLLLSCTAEPLQGPGADGTLQPLPRGPHPANAGAAPPGPATEPQDAGEEQPPADEGRVESEGPPTDGELERWVGWESRVSAALAAARPVPSSDGTLPEQGVLEEEASRAGLTLPRAILLRERIFAVLGERARVVVQKALVATLEQAERTLPPAERDHLELRARMRQAREDLRSSTRAAGARALYGNRWVDAILRREDRIAGAYRDALEQAAAQARREAGALPRRPAPGQ